MLQTLTRTARLALLLVLLAGLLSACQSMQFSPVSESPTNQHLPGKFVWYDLVTPDVAAAQTFYAGLFGWTFETQKGYTLIRNQGRAIGGMLATQSSADTPNGRWVTSLSVADVDASAAQVRALGGQILDGPVDIPQRGWFVFVSDNQGAQLGLLHAAGGDPLDRIPAMGDWLWTELWSNDLTASLDFYQRLMGYQAEGVSADVRSASYRVLSVAGRWRAGAAQIPWDDVKDQWMPYVRVADVAGLVVQAERLGGKIYTQTETRRPMALIAAPDGAVLMVEQWTPPADVQLNGGAEQ